MALHAHNLNDSSEKPFAVILNSNARRVSSRVESKIRELVAPEHVYTSKSFDEARDITHAIIDRKYETVFTGGGDGTVTHFIDAAQNIVAKENRWWNLLRHQRETIEGPFQMPDIGILKLGTGNALASVVGSGDYCADLQRYIHNGFSDAINLSLIESNGRRFPFAGVGWDAHILNEYKILQQRFGDTIAKSLVESLGGYLAAFFVKFVPKQLWRSLSQRRIEVEITSLGGAARLAQHGRPAESFESGQVLYSGPCNLAIVGTEPFYGYGFKVLPYANQYQNRFQLRVVKQGMLRTLSSLPSIWKGKYYNPEGIIDFAVEGVRLKFSEAVPTQVAGDANGFASEVEYRLSSRSIRLIDYH